MIGLENWWRWQAHKLHFEGDEHVNRMTTVTFKKKVENPKSQIERRIEASLTAVKEQATKKEILQYIEENHISWKFLNNNLWLYIYD